MNTNNTYTHFYRGYWIALSSAVVLSTTAIFIRYLTQTFQLPALILAVWREGFVALTLLIFFSLFRPKWLQVDRSHLPVLIVYGLILAAFNSTWTLSVAWNGAAISTVLVYSSAGFTALLGWWLLKESLGWIKIGIVILCLAGCVFVSNALDLTAWSSNGIGILTGLLSGLSYAVYSMMGRSTAQRGLNPWTTLLYIFSFATVFLLIINLIPNNQIPGAAQSSQDLLWLGTSLQGWTILVILAAGPTVMGYGLYNASLAHLPASTANLIVSMEPVFTAIIAYILLAERLTGVQVIGSVMILAGVFLLRIDERRKKRIGKKPLPELSPKQIK